MSRARPADDTHMWAGDERRLRLESMFQEYAPRILDYARHRGAALAEAEDIVSEVFLVLARRIDDAPDNILPWLYGVARKVLGNHRRSEQRRRALAQRIETAERKRSWLHSAAPEALPIGSGVVIRQALSKLSAKDREVLLLVAWDELSYSEAAESLGCSSAAFAQMLRRARQRMVEAIEQIRAHETAHWAADGS